MPNLLDVPQITGDGDVIPSPPLHIEQVSQGDPAAAVEGGKGGNFSRSPADKSIRTYAISLHRNRACFLAPKRHAGSIYHERRTRYAPMKDVTFLDFRKTDPIRLRSQPTHREGTDTFLMCLHSSPQRYAPHPEGRPR